MLILIVVLFAVAAVAVNVWGRTPAEQPGTDSRTAIGPASAASPAPATPSSEDAEDRELPVHDI